MQPLFYTFTFYLFGLIAIASSLLFVTRKSPVAAALWLVNAMFCLAALFVLLDAQFLGAIQVLLYAGAIMVVFLFVVMLLNLGHPSEISDIRGLLGKILGGAAALVILAQVMASRRIMPAPALTAGADSLAVVARTSDAVTPLAHSLFTDYLLAFEVTSVLLVAAVIGAVVLGRKRDAAESGVANAR